MNEAIQCYKGQYFYSNWNSNHNFSPCKKQKSDMDSNQCIYRLDSMGNKDANSIY